MKSNSSILRMLAVWTVAGVAACSSPPPPEVDCNDACVSGERCLDGACVVLCNVSGDCPQGEGCCAGTCSADCFACPVGKENCPGSTECTDLTSSFSQCGACANSCDTVLPLRADLCRAGECVCGLGTVACALNMTCCDGICLDVSVDHTNCGLCGRVCSNLELCTDGQCLPSADNDCGELTTCQQDAAAECADTDSNNQHCGGCNNSCAVTVGNRADACVQGACVCSGASNTLCPGGEICASDGCRSSRCGAATCPHGCCDENGSCQAASYTRCGLQGSQCVDCTGAAGVAVNGCSESGSCTCLSSGTACQIGEVCVADGCIPQEDACEGGLSEGDPCQTAGYTCQRGSCAPAFLTWIQSSHTIIDCTTIDGTVFTANNGKTICRISANRCPDGWSQAALFQRYDPSTWGGDYCSHFFSSGPATFKNERAYVYSPPPVTGYAEDTDYSCPLDCWIRSSCERGTGPLGCQAWRHCWWPDPVVTTSNHSPNNNRVEIGCY